MSKSREIILTLNIGDDAILSLMDNFESVLKSVADITDDKRKTIVEHLRKRALEADKENVINNALKILEEIDKEFQSWLSEQVNRRDIPPTNYFMLLSYLDILPEGRIHLAIEYTRHIIQELSNDSIPDEYRLELNERFADAAGHIIAEISMVEAEKEDREDGEKRTNEDA